jgi:GNAT superfamily N-acetyltransferase
MKENGTRNGMHTGAKENEIDAFVRSLGLETDPHYVIPGTGLEIDCFIPSLNVGIEYCGLYYHAEPPENCDPRLHAKHRNKRDAAAANGIYLVTMFEDEWLLRRSQVEGVLRVMLHKPVRTVSARNCSVVSIDRNTANTFLREHHLLGAHARVWASWGMYYQDELIGVLTLSHNYAEKNVAVMQRLCFSGGVHVRGGASKLLKRAVAWAREERLLAIMTYSDNRWSVGNVYERTGFTCVLENKYDYSYVDFSVPMHQRTRINKKTQQKQKVACPSNMTERMWAYHRGFWRIWDCGHKHWRMNL